MVIVVVLDTLVVEAWRRVAHEKEHRRRYSLDRDSRREPRRDLHPMDGVSQHNGQASTKT